MLELRNVSKVYKTKSQDVLALDNVSLMFEETGLVFVTGKSGSGKTTLLNAIGGLDDISSGEIVIDNKSTKNFTKADFDSYRNTYLGFIFQEYNLIESMTIWQNLALATELQGRKLSHEEIDEVLAKVGLEDVGPRRPQELSGGQRQRVAIARALIKNPSIIIADEPTGALDTATGIQIASLLKKLSKEKLVIVVSHDLSLADKFADRIINMVDGKIESDVTVTIDSTEKRRVLKQKNMFFIQRGSKLDDKDVSRLKVAIEEGKDVAVVDNINIQKKKTVVEKKESSKKYSAFKTRMGFLSTLKLGLNTLKARKTRLVITVILCAIAFSVFGVCDALSIYDQGRLTTNTLKSSLSPATSISVEITESTGNSYDISVNSSLIESVEKQTGYDVKGVFSSYSASQSTPSEVKGTNYTISKYYYYKALKGVVEFDEEDLEDYGFSMLSGRLPTMTLDADGTIESREIAISKYYAYCLVNWGYTTASGTVIQDIEDLVNESDPLILTLGTTNNKQSYKIVGIVDTGKINSKFDSLIDNYEEGKSTLQNEFLNYVNNSLLLYGFVADGYAAYLTQENNAAAKYINSAYSFNFGDELGTRTQFYNFADIANLTTNYAFVNEDKITLSGNEIMLNVSQFATIYADEIESINKILSSTTNSAFDGYYSNINESYIPSLTSTSYTAEQKLENFRLLVEMMNEVQAYYDEVTYGSTYTRASSILEKSVSVEKFDTSRYVSGTKTYAQVTLENSTYTVVGFYVGSASDISTISITASSSIVTSLEGMANLGVDTNQGIYSSILATNLGSGSASKLSNLFMRTSGICYYSETNLTLATIEANSEFFEGLSLLFVIVAAVFAAFSILMFANLISNSIRSKQGEIGILRAIGARGRDVMNIFVIESVIIALFNAVIACVVSFFGCMLLNAFLASYFSLYISLASFGIRQVLIIFALSLVVGVLSSVIPVSSISKQKPVESIRKSF